MFLFTKENAVGLVRTGVVYLYSWLITLVPQVGEVLNDAGVNEELFVLIAGTLLYQLIRWGAEKWSWLGSFLIFNKKPDYGEYVAKKDSSDGPVLKAVEGDDIEYF